MRDRSWRNLFLVSLPHDERAQTSRNSGINRTAQCHLQLLRIGIVPRGELVHQGQQTFVFHAYSVNCMLQGRDVEN